jgi:hypothetical protein
LREKGGSREGLIEEQARTVEQQRMEIMNLHSDLVRQVWEVKELRERNE